MVFQNYALYPHMNIRDNMGFGLKIRQLPQAEIDARVHEAADILGLEDLLERKPKELSGGQRQRVAVGRAIVRKPKLFLFDEPLSNLDAKLRVAMRAEISKLHRRLGATIIYVTHDQVEAMTMADRIFIMNNGVLQQSGAPMEVYASAGEPVRRRIHRLAGDELRRRHGGRGGGRRCSSTPAASASGCPRRFALRSQPYVGRQVVFGVRPGGHRGARRRGRSAGTGNTVAARADVVETLGSEIFAHLTCGAHSIVARMEVPEAPAARRRDAARRPSGWRRPTFSTTRRRGPSSRSTSTPQRQDWAPVLATWGAPGHAVPASAAPA